MAGRVGKRVVEYDEPGGRHIKEEHPIIPENQPSPPEVGPQYLDDAAIAALKMAHTLGGSAARKVTVSRVLDDGTEQWEGELTIPHEIDPECPQRVIAERYGGGTYWLSFKVPTESGDEYPQRIPMKLAGAPKKQTQTLPIGGVQLPQPTNAQEAQLMSVVTVMMESERQRAESLREDLRHEREKAAQADKRMFESVLAMQSQVMGMLQGQIMQQQQDQRKDKTIDELLKLKELFGAGKDTGDVVREIMNGFRLIKTAARLTGDEATDQGLMQQILSHPKGQELAGILIEKASGVLTRAGNAPTQGAQTAGPIAPASAALPEPTPEQQAAGMRQELESFWLRTIMKVAANNGDPYTAKEFLVSRFGGQIVQLLPMLGFTTEELSKEPPELTSFFKKYPLSMNYRDFFIELVFYLTHPAAVPEDEGQSPERE